MANVSDNWDDLGPTRAEVIEATRDEARILSRRITELERKLMEAQSGWDSCIADLRKAAEICQGVQNDLIKARKAATWVLIDPSMRFTKHHVLAYPQDGLSSDDTFVMAYTGGYRTGQDALDDEWMYTMLINAQQTAGEEKKA